MKTAGVPETTSVIGAKDSHVDTANTAAIVNGDNGNKYTTNTYNLTLILPQQSGKQMMHNKMQKHMTETDCFDKVPSVKKTSSRVRLDSGSDTSVMVEYTQPSSENTNIENQVATQREATTGDGNQIVETQCFQHDTHHIGINIRDGTFSEPQRLGVEIRTQAFQYDQQILKLDTSTESTEETEDENDWEFVDIPNDNSGTKHYDVEEREVGTRVGEKKRETSTMVDGISQCGTTDISLRQYDKDCLDGNNTHLPEDVVPDDTGWSRDGSEAGADVTQLLLEDDTDNSETEHTLRKPTAMSGMVGEESRSLKKRRNSTVFKIVDDLRGITNRLGRNWIKHLVEDVVFVLRYNPMKVDELSRKIDTIIHAMRYLDATGAQPEEKRSEVSETDTIFAESLTGDLDKIGIPHVRHEAEQIVESILCLGSLKINELHEFGKFVKGLKLGH